MSFPTVENGPWTFDVNNNCTGASVADTLKNVLLQIKDSWVGFSVWSVVASSDSSSVKNIGDASPDLWVDTGDIVRASAGSPHSWIILESSVTGEQLCIDYTGTTDVRVGFYISANGTYNADGTTSNRPTATQANAVQQPTVNFINPGVDGAIVHSMISNDEKCTRCIVHCRSGSSNGDTVICLEEIVNTPSQWTDTLKRGWSYNEVDQAVTSLNTTKSPALTDYETLNGFVVDTQAPFGPAGCFITSEAYGSFSTDAATPIFKVATELPWAGGYPVSQMGLWLSSAVNGGGYGRLQDLYWAHYYHDTYDTYNSSSSRQWVKIGCFMFPWNGTQPLEVP